MHDHRDRTPATSLLDALLHLSRAVQAIAAQQGNNGASADADRAERWIVNKLAEVTGDGEPTVGGPTP